MGYAEDLNAAGILTRDQFERAVKQEGMDRATAQAARLERDRREFAFNRKKALDENPRLSAVGSPISAALNYGNMAAAGAPAAAVSALTAPVTALRQGIGLGDAYEVNKAQADRILGASPVAAAAGQIAAGLTPTPYGSLLRATGNAAAAPLARSAAHLAERSLAASGAAQLAAAYAGSAAAITADQAARGTFDGRNLAEVGQDIARQFFSPLNLAVSTAAGGLPALARTHSDPIARRFLDRARQVLPGFKPTPDMARNPDGYIATVIDTLAKSPYGRRIAADYMQERYYKPLETTLKSITARAGGTGAGAAAAGDAVQDLVGTAAKAGKVKAAIAARGGAAFRQVGGDDVPAPVLERLSRTMAALDARAASRGGTMGPRGEKAMSAVFGDADGSLRNVLDRAARGELRVTWSMLEEVRQHVGDIAQYEKMAKAGGLAATGIAARDGREARVMYRALRSAYRAEQSGTLDSAMRDIAELRGLEKSLRPLANVSDQGDAIQRANAMFTATDFQKRWTTAQRMLRSDQVDAIRGAYLADFLEEVSLWRGNANTPNRALSESAIRDLTGPTARGKFRPEVFDRVLPGVRQEFEEIGRISGMVMRGIGRAEGSPTARRMQDLDLVTAGTQLPGMAVDAVKDPSTGWVLAQHVLKPVGLFWLASSIVNGKVAKALNGLAMGETVVPPTMPAAIISQQGGGPGLVELGENTARAATQ